jgi:serine/threonine-protein kinase HipA
VLRDKKVLQDKIHSTKDHGEALALIRIGSSAGGARSKAVIALSSKGTILDGTVRHGTDYSYWILKFDNQGNSDRDNSDPKGAPTLEYIFSQIARKAGINLPETRLLESGEERHFLIERFDRIRRNGKIDQLHYASSCGLAQVDRDLPHTYEQLVLLIRQLKLGQSAVDEIFRRAVFNIIGRNQDDHSKNTGFLMDRKGIWTLAPAFDLTFSYDPQGQWTRNHQCSLNGKNQDFELKDLLEFGRFCNLENKKSLEIIQLVGEAFSSFSSMAVEYEVPTELRQMVERNLRLWLAG